MEFPHSGIFTEINFNQENDGVNYNELTISEHMIDVIGFTVSGYIIGTMPLNFINLNPWARAEVPAPVEEPKPERILKPVPIIDLTWDD
jgi:hypothetical protein